MATLQGALVKVDDVLSFIEEASRHRISVRPHSEPGWWLIDCPPQYGRLGPPVFSRQLSAALRTTVIAFFPRPLLLWSTFSTGRTATSGGNFGTISIAADGSPKKGPLRLGSRPTFSRMMRERRTENVGPEACPTISRKWISTVTIERKSQAIRLKLWTSSAKATWCTCAGRTA